MGLFRSLILGVGSADLTVCVCTCLSGFCFHFTCFLHNKGEKKWFAMPSKCGKDRERWSGETRFNYWCVCCCNCCFVGRANKNNRKTNDVYQIFFVHSFVSFLYNRIFFLARGKYLYVLHTCAVDGQKTTLGPGRWATKNQTKNKFCFSIPSCLLAIHTHRQRTGGRKEKKNGVRLLFFDTTIHSICLFC